MTTVVLASSYLSGSLLSMLVPMATVILVLAWGVFLIRRHERHRERLETGDRSAAVADSGDGSRSAGAG
jgi:hypothetical protein